MRLTEQARVAEIKALVDALSQTGGNVAGAARALALPLRSIWRRLDKYNIRPDSYRPAQEARK
jgi:transcriptional regulator with GAF, ATPase, and Fis domain